MLGDNRAISEDSRKFGADRRLQDHREGRRLLKKFPVGPYGRQRLQFYPAPFRAPLRAFAGLVFPWMDGKF